MNNTLIGITIAVILLGSFLYGNSKIEKTPEGFVFKDATVHTYYTSRIIWGEGYFDHDDATAVHNTEVVAFGDGWEFTTTTDDDGYFTVEVKAGVVFNLRASDGNSWSTTKDPIAGVAVGTTFSDRI